MRGSTWRRSRASGATRRTKQEVAGRVAAAGCGAGTHLLGRGGEDDRGGGGWAGLASWAGQAAQELGRR